MFVSCVSQSEIDFEGYSLILPAISIGNVGQLAVDLMIYNLDVKRIGYIYDDCILPLVGNDPFGSSGVQEGSLATSSEVFKCDEKKIIFLQLRAPLAKGRKQTFCDRITKWIKDCGFERTILLTSIVASERLDSQIQNGPFRYILSSEAQDLHDIFKEKYSWRVLEERNTFHDDDLVESSRKDVFLPGGGFSKRFYETCCRKDIPLVTFLVFCAEGDNIPDAMILLYHTDFWLNFKNMVDMNQMGTEHPEYMCNNFTAKWCQPPSWKNLYGTPSYASIF